LALFLWSASSKINAILAALISWFTILRDALAAYAKEQYALTALAAESEARKSAETKVQQANLALCQAKAEVQSSVQVTSALRAHIFELEQEALTVQDKLKSAESTFAASRIAAKRSTAEFRELLEDHERYVMVAYKKEQNALAALATESRARKLADEKVQEANLALCQAKADAQENAEATVVLRARILELEQEALAVQSKCKSAEDKARNASSALADAKAAANKDAEVVVKLRETIEAQRHDTLAADEKVKLLTAEAKADADKSAAIIANLRQNMLAAEEQAQLFSSHAKAESEKDAGLIARLRESILDLRQDTLAAEDKAQLVSSQAKADTEKSAVIIATLRENIAKLRQNLTVAEEKAHLLTAQHKADAEKDAGTIAELRKSIKALQENTVAEEHKVVTARTNDVVVASPLCSVSVPKHALGLVTPPRVSLSAPRQSNPQSVPCSVAIATANLAVSSVAVVEGLSVVVVPTPPTVPAPFALVFAPRPPVLAGGSGLIPPPTEALTKAINAAAVSCTTNTFLESDYYYKSAPSSKEDIAARPKKALPVRRARQ
jgi:hypothetical protein